VCGCAAALGIGVNVDRVAISANPVIHDYTRKYLRCLKNIV
jgi:hypothetical protein